MKNAKLALVGGTASCALLFLYACTDIIGTRDLTYSATAGDSDGSPGSGDGSTPDDDGSTGTGDSGPGADGATVDGATPCTDTTSDSNNCGQCGHSCFGGKCKGSVCQPVPIAPMLPNSIALAVDDKAVYFSDNLNGMIYSVDKLGQSKTLLSSGVPSAFGLVSDGTTLYVAAYEATGSGGGIYACSLPTCGGTATRIAPLAMPRWLALGTPGQTLFSIGDDAVTRIDLKPSVTTRILAEPGVQGFHIAADANNVYYTDLTNNIHATPITADGGPPAQSFGDSTGNFAGDIILNGANVYWTYGNVSPSPGKVQGLAKTGAGSPVVFGTAANTAVYPFGLATDGTTMFWISHDSTDGAGDGTLQSCPIAGCTTPTVLLTGLPDPDSIAIDATSIYISCSGNPGDNNGEILRLAKPLP